jgi:hypothetical protein
MTTAFGPGISVPRGVLARIRTILERLAPGAQCERCSAPAVAVLDRGAELEPLCRACAALVVRAGEERAWWTTGAGDEVIH